MWLSSRQQRLLFLQGAYSSPYGLLWWLGEGTICGGGEKCTFANSPSAPLFHLGRRAYLFQPLMSPWTKSVWRAMCHGWSFPNFKGQVPLSTEGTACHPNGPKHSLPQLVSPKQADPRLLGCSEGIWEIQQMAPQKCCFPFGGRIREQRGLVHLCVWRWRLAGSPARLLLSSGSHLPWDGPAFEPGLAKQVLTTTTHPAGNLLFCF